MNESVRERGGKLKRHNKAHQGSRFRPLFLFWIKVGPDQRKPVSRNLPPKRRTGNQNKTKQNPLSFLISHFSVLSHTYLPLFTVSSIHPTISATTTRSLFFFFFFFFPYSSHGGNCSISENTSSQLTDVVSTPTPNLYRFSTASDVEDFKHIALSPSEKDLRADLGKMGIRGHIAQNVIGKVRNRDYQSACTLTFEPVHGSSCDAGINHPNQYFTDSQKILQSKKISTA